MSTFNNQTKKIEEIKSWFQNPLKGILKYIEHDQLDINVYFFWNNKIINQDLINTLVLEFQKKIQKIKEMKYEVINSNLSDVEKNFLLNSLNTSALKFILFKYSIYLEAEKAWFELSKEIRNLCLKKVNKLQNIIYWPEISSVIPEKEDVLSTLHELFELKWNKLNHDEQTFFRDFLNSFDFDYVKEISDSKIKKDKLEDIFLSKEKVVQLFEIVLDIYWLKERKVSVENVWNFSVRKNQIVIPEWKFDITSLKRILQLIDHEVWVHAIRWFNTEVTLKTAWDWYIEWEEWFAMLVERLFDENILEIKSSSTKSHISSFIAENFDWKTTQEILRIYYKMVMNEWVSDDIISKEAKDRMLRVKRFVSLEEKWANRKDVSYTRGQYSILTYIQNIEVGWIANFLKDFYFSELSVDDIWLVKDFREILVINEKELKYPLWIWKILYKKLSWEKVFLEKLKQEDFRFESIDKLSFDIKRKIIKILSIINNK